MVMKCIGAYSRVGIGTEYRLDGRCSIPDRGKKFVSSSQRPDQLRGLPSFLLGGGVSFPGGKAAGA
jgi:hypothetical protein